MDLVTLTRIVLRRWYVSFPVIVIAIVVGQSMLKSVKPQYLAEGSILLLSPSVDLEEGQPPRVRNPYMEFSASLRTTAQAIVQVVSGPAGQARVSQLLGDTDYEIEVAEEGPIVNIKGTANRRDLAILKVTVVTDALIKELSLRQEAVQARRELRISTRHLLEPTSARELIAPRVRAVAATVALGLVAVFIPALVAEKLAVGLAARRRRRIRKAVFVLTSRVVGFRGDPVNVLTLFVAAVIVVPSRFTIGPFAVTAATAIAFVIALALIASTLVPPSLIDRRVHPLSVALAVFLGIVILTYADSHLRFLTPIEGRGADRNLALLIGLCAVTIMASDGLRSRAQVHRVVAVLTASAAAVAVIGIFQFSYGIAIEQYIRPPGFTAEKADFIESRAGFRRVGGTARHPIEMGIVWAGCLPFALYLAQHSSTRGRRQAASAATLPIAIALPMALSRSAAAGLAASLLLLIPTWSFRRIGRLALGAVLVFAVLSLATPQLLPTMIDLLQGEAGVGSLEARAKANEAGLALASERVWLGRGFGTYSSAEQFHIGNLYLEALIEVGVVGLAAFVGLLAVATSVASRARRRTQDPAMRDLAWTIVAAIVGIGVAGWGLNHLKYPMLAALLFLVVGLAGTLDRMTRRTAPRLRRGLREMITTPQPRLRPPASKVEYDLGRFAARRFRTAVMEAIARQGPCRACEVGGGAKPFLSVSEITRLGVDYTVLDVSPTELAKAPDGYHKVVADIAAADIDVGRRFDVVFSRMVAEHIADPRQFHRNVARLLNPGGIAVHVFATLYAPPFVVNRVLPERLSSWLLLRLRPGRVSSGTGGKFPAYYRWCRGPSARQLRRLKSTGFVVERYVGLFGTDSYYRRWRRVQRLEDRVAEWLRDRPLPALTSYAVVVLRPDGSA